MHRSSARFVDINVALAEGWVPATPCVCGPDTGAMGVHLVWGVHNPPPAVPALDGNLLNYIGGPNRFGLPAFYELHVWAWERNPKGTLADWNTHVTCDHQPVSAEGGAKAP